MKISGSLGNNINFIEQKTNNIKAKAIQSEGVKQTRVDSFDSQSISKIDFSSQNNFLGMLEVAAESIDKLKENSKTLYGLAEKFSFFESEQNNLSLQFDETIESMYTVVDSTVYEKTQLFYTNISFSSDKAMPSFMMSEIISIDDLSIENVDGLNVFEKKLDSLKDEIQSSQTYLQHASFNSLAALSYRDNIEEVKAEVTAQGLERAHDNKLFSR